jgi:hypothetical protein
MQKGKGGEVNLVIGQDARRLVCEASMQAAQGAYLGSSTFMVAGGLGRQRRRSSSTGVTEGHWTLASLTLKMP